MEVNKIISHHLYSSYCRTLQYDEYLHRYTFNVDAISDDFIYRIKSTVFNHLNRNRSIEQIRQRVNNLSHEVSHPVYRKEAVQPCILFKDIIPGETISFTIPAGHHSIELIKLNEKNWLVLNSDCQEYKQGSFLKMEEGESVYDWFDSCEKKFVYSGNFHDSMDKIYLRHLYKNTITSSIAPLYERLNEAHNVGRLCSEWKEIIELAGSMGCGSYTVRRLLDSITAQKDDTRN